MCSEILNNHKQSIYQLHTCDQCIVWKVRCFMFQASVMDTSVLKIIRSSSSTTVNNVLTAEIGTGHGCRLATGWVVWAAWFKYVCANPKALGDDSNH